MHEKKRTSSSTTATLKPYTHHISRRMRAVQYTPDHAYIHTNAVWKWLDFTNLTDTISESNILELIQYQNTVCNCVTLHRCVYSLPCARATLIYKECILCRFFCCYRYRVFIQTQLDPLLTLASAEMVLLFCYVFVYMCTAYTYKCIRLQCTCSAGERGAPSCDCMK